MKKDFKLKNKLLKGYSFISTMAIASTPSTAYASDVTLADLGTAGTVILKLLSLVFLICRLGGFVAAIFGAAQLIKFIQNHETAPPDALPKALGFLLGGIALFFIKEILKAIGLEFK